MKNITRRGFVKGAAIAPLAVSHLGLGSSSDAQEDPSTAQASTQATTQALGTDHFDIVVAGGGHNSLVTAAYLSKAGYRCVVLEGRPLLGGGTHVERFP
jgi:ribulose 1,5-bisphosphate synthetase/thiazole synthase